MEWGPRKDPKPYLFERRNSILRKKAGGAKEGKKRSIRGSRTIPAEGIRFEEKKNFGSPAGLLKLDKMDF